MLHYVFRYTKSGIFLNREFPKHEYSREMHVLMRFEIIYLGRGEDIFSMRINRAIISNSDIVSLDCQYFGAFKGFKMTQGATKDKI